MGKLSDVFGNQGFDTDSVEPADEGGFEALPTGWYPIEIKTAKVEPTSKGNAMMLTLMVSVIDGQKKGRTVFARILLQHPTKEAQEIGHRQLSALGKAVGMPRVHDEDKLIGQRLDARVVKEPAKNGYKESNSIQTYAKLGHHSAKPQAQEAAPAKETAGSTKAVWE